MKKFTIIYGIIFLFLLSLWGLSYAFFTAGISGAESESSITIAGGKMDIEYISGNTIVGNLIAPGWSDTKEFSVIGTNTTDLKMKYSIALVIDDNTFSDGAVTYSLSGTNASSNGVLAPNVTNIKTGTGKQTINVGNGLFDGNADEINHHYVLTVAFPETEYDQNIDQKKHIAAHIVISGSEVKNITLNSTNNSLLGTTGQNLFNYQIYGNTLQNGVPTPTSPVTIQNLGRYNSSTNKYEIDVTSKGKNLMPYDDFTHTNTSYWRPNQNVIVSQESDYYQVLFNQTGSTPGLIHWGINDLVKPEEKYTISFKAKGIGISSIRFSIGQGARDVSTNWTVASNDFKVYSHTFTIPDETYTEYFLFYGYGVVPGNGFQLKWIQIEEGDTATPYTKYEEPITTKISLDEPLRCIDDTCDYIDYKEGKLHKLVGYREFTGTSPEVWNKYNSSLNLYYYDSDFGGVSGTNKSLSNYFTFSGGSLASNLDEHRLQQTGSASNRAYYSSSTITDANSFSSWVASKKSEGVPLNVQYKLYRPVVSNVTLPFIKSFNGTTYLSASDGNLSASKIITNY